MKKLISLIVWISLLSDIQAQDSMEKVMEARVKEFHRVLSLSSKEDYKKFMIENYTKEFLERPIKLNKVVGDDSGGSPTDDGKPLDNLEAKAGLYQQIHNDFRGVPIASLKTTGNKTEMILKSMGLKGKFIFTFSKEKPFLIEALGVEADMEN